MVIWINGTIEKHLPLSWSLAKPKEEAAVSDIFRVLSFEGFAVIIPYIVYASLK